MLENPVPPEGLARGEISGAQQRFALQFVRALMTDSVWLEAQVIEASDLYVRYWAKHIQPIISKDQSRPDRNWDWLTIFGKTSVVTRLASFLGQRQKTYCIIARDLKGISFPIGLLHLVQGYRWVLDHNDKSTFLWYLAAAPRSVIDERFAIRPRMMAAFIDIGLVVSMNDGNEGRVFLHADPAGGSKLEASYVRGGMVRANAKAKLSSARKVLARHNERKTGVADVYFYVDEPRARSLLNLSDPFRSYSSGGR